MGLSIEIGSIGSAVSGIASSVGRVGGAIEGGLGGAGQVGGLSVPALGLAPLSPTALDLGGSLGKGIDFIGPKMGLSDIGPLTNEGPAGFLGLENTMTIAKPSNPVADKFNTLIGQSVPLEPTVPDLGGGFRPAEELSFTQTTVIKPKIELNPIEKVKEAESIIAQVQKPLRESGVLVGVNNLVDNNLYDRTPYCHRVHGHTLIRSSTSTLFETPLSPAVEPALEMQTKTEAVNLTQPSQAVSLQSNLQTQYEEVAEVEQVLKEEVKKSNPEVKNSKESLLHKINLVEAVKVSQRRKEKIKAAVKRLKGMPIIGQAVVKLLETSFWTDKSPIVKDKADGTIKLTASALESNPAVYISEEEAVRAFTLEVENNIPVEEGGGKRKATWEDVRKVIEGGESELETSKPKKPAEIVIRRIREIREIASGQQAVPITISEKVEIEPGEATLGKLGLAGVFPKAA